jgi:hypothetical protein
MILIRSFVIVALPVAAARVTRSMSARDEVHEH